ncbi:hypothetical protein JHK87_055490 [Glycine soja]|nr:hypothetical protein JHK87_055490 [Glycine soja]
MLLRNQRVHTSDIVEVFYPERFANSNVDMRGYDIILLPFASGRRGCHRIHLGLTTIKIVLAQLVHCFNWELPLGMSPDDLDMLRNLASQFQEVAKAISCALFPDAFLLCP